LEQWNRFDGILLGREGGVNNTPHADTRGICISAKRENETAHNIPIEILGSICREASANQFPTSLNRAHPNSAKMGMQEFSYSDRKILSTREFCPKAGRGNRATPFILGIRDDRQSGHHRKCCLPPGSGATILELTVLA
jgi:hypothetical protein